MTLPQRMVFPRQILLYTFIIIIFKIIIITFFINYYYYKNTGDVDTAPGDKNIPLPCLVMANLSPVFIKL